MDNIILNFKYFLPENRINPIFSNINRNWLKFVKVEFMFDSSICVSIPIVNIVMAEENIDNKFKDLVL